MSLSGYNIGTFTRQKVLECGLLVWDLRVNFPNRGFSAATLHLCLTLLLPVFVWTKCVLTDILTCRSLLPSQLTCRSLTLPLLCNLHSSQVLYSLLLSDFMLWCPEPYLPPCLYHRNSDSAQASLTALPHGASTGPEHL